MVSTKTVTGSMESKIGVTIDGQGGGPLGPGDANTIGNAVANAAHAVFSIELKKVLIAAST